MNPRVRLPPLREGADNTQHARDIEQLPCIQHAARIRTAESIIDILQPAEGRPAEPGEQHMGVRRLIQQRLRHGKTALGSEIEGVFTGVLAACELRQLLKHLVEFKRLRVFFKEFHIILLYAAFGIIPPSAQPLCPLLSRRRWCRR